MNPEDIFSKLAAEDIELPSPPEAKGNYLPYSIAGDLIYISGSLPTKGTEVAYTGKVGAEQTVETAYEGAKLCVVNALAHLRNATDNFERFDGIVHVAGFVNGVDGFAESPKVVNGASDFLVKVFSDAGKHSRVAVSVNGLPLDATVEIQIIARLHDPFPPHS